MYKIPKQDNVDLKQIKIIGGAVEFKATITVSEGEEVFVNNVQDKYMFPPHQDLVDSIEKLKKPLATMCGLIDAENMVLTKEFSANKSQLESLKNYMTFKMAEINVSGMSLSGEDGNRGIVITGSFKGQAINSRKVKFTSDLPFEDDFVKLVEEITDEVYRYVFEGKKAELQAFNEPVQMHIEDGEE